MNPLSQIIAANDVRLDVDVADRGQLLAELATLLAGRSGVARDFVLDRLTAREGLGSTAIGHGIAIPHCRVSQCAMAVGALIRTRAPLAFDAPDHKPVALFVGLILPTHAGEPSLQILAAASMLCSNRAWREAVTGATSPREVVDLLQRQIEV